MDKNGSEISILALFLVALLLGGGALFIMFFNNYDYGDKSKYISEIMSEGDFAKEYVFKISALIVNEGINCKTEAYGDICSEGDMKEKIARVAEKKDEKYFGAGNFFLKLNKREFTFEEKEEGYKFFMSDVFVLSERGGNKVKKNFNVSIEFDDKGKAIRFIND